MLLFNLLISIFIGKLLALIYSFNGLLCKFLNIHCIVLLAFDLIVL